MKKVFSLCLVVLLLFSMVPMTTFATEIEGQSLRELEQTIRRNSKAEITDANGNVLEKLDIDVQVQQINASRSVDGAMYAITCTARSINNDEYSDSDSKDGYIATIVMVCNDVPGTSNLLVSVSGNFSGTESETKDRKVTYASYDVYDKNISSKTEAVGLSYMFNPTDYKGFTFRAWASATITQSGNQLNLYVTTDAV